MLAAGIVLIAGQAQTDEIGVRLPTRPSITDTFLFNDPGNAKIVTVLFSGGDGVIRISGEGPLSHHGYMGVEDKAVDAIAGFVLQ